jgi:hypothetical protein
MSVLIVMKVTGDTDQFRRWCADEQRLRDLAERARAEGAIHHRFAIGDGYVVAVDEWETLDRFQAFIATMPEVFAEAGAQAEPEITVAEVFHTADEF